MLSSIEIVYRHDDFIIINKPAGLSVHKDEDDIGLTHYISIKLGLPQVWLVHRLDKVTSGLLILALNKNAARELSKLFSNHLIQKTYLAISNTKPKKKQGKIIGDMEKSRRGMWKLCQTRENPAITQFTSFSLQPNLRLFLLQPKTGKTHQLRVAMKSLSSPILGDELYGSKEHQVDRTYLHAYKLEFTYQDVDFIIQCLPTQGILFQNNCVKEALENL